MPYQVNTTPRKLLPLLLKYPSLTVYDRSMQQENWLSTRPQHYTPQEGMGTTRRRRVVPQAPVKSRDTKTVPAKSTGRVRRTLFAPGSREESLRQPDVIDLTGEDEVLQEFDSDEEESVELVSPSQYRASEILERNKRSGDRIHLAKKASVPRSGRGGENETPRKRVRREGTEDDEEVPSTPTGICGGGRDILNGLGEWDGTHAGYLIEVMPKVFPQPWKNKLEATNGLMLLDRPVFFDPSGSGWRPSGRPFLWSKRSHPSPSKYPRRRSVLQQDAWEIREDDMSTMLTTDPQGDLLETVQLGIPTVCPLQVRGSYTQNLHALRTVSSQL